jgi:hypothetical protein
MKSSDNYQTRNEIAREKISSFQQLPKGWDYGVGIPATSIAASSALTLLECLASESLSINVFPQTNGGITLNIWKQLQNVIEVRVSPTTENCYDFMQEQEVSGVSDIVNEGENFILAQLVSTIWKLLGLSTSENTIQTSSDSRPIVSEISTVLFRYSTNDVRKQKGVYAIILVNTTPRPLETQSFIGSYQPKKLLPFMTT